jgi:hypothetical protein
VGAGAVVSGCCASAGAAANSISAMMAMRAMRDNGETVVIVARQHTSARQGGEATRARATAAAPALSHSANSVRSPPHPNSGSPEFGTLSGRSRIYPTSAGEGLGVGVVVRGNAGASPHHGHPLIKPRRYSS